MDDAARLPLLECLLFCHCEPVSTEQLATWLECDEESVEGLAQTLDRRLADHSLQVARVNQGYLLQTRPEWGDTLSAILSQTPPAPLSHGAWETLAVVAYRQPITRMEIEAIRQVGSERALATLVERGLIEEVGRKETPGRPILYGTTGSFLRQFGLNRVGDFPPLEDVPDPA